jgi:protein ImuA
MNIITMKSLHQQQVFEKLRSRFGMPGGAGFSPNSTVSAAPSAFPAALLRSGLHECLGQGSGDFPSVLAFSLLAAGLSKDEGKPVFVLRLKNTCQELGNLYGHGVHALGLDVAQIITVSIKSEKELLWAAEEIAVSQTARAAIVALGGHEKIYGFTASRRLKLRTERSPTSIFVLRHWGQGGATAAHSRWRIARSPSLTELKKAPGTALLGRPQLSAFLERGPNALFTSWEIECHAPGCFGMAPLLADRAPGTRACACKAA